MYVNKKIYFDNAIIESFYILVHFNIFPFVTNFLYFLSGSLDCSDDSSENSSVNQLSYHQCSYS